MRSILKKLVSILTPCFNGAMYLPSFLDSIICQTYRPIEFIFIDDGSTDETYNVFHSYEGLLSSAGINVQYIYQSNAGQAAAINKGLAIFHGEYLMWVDSDDILLPNNIEVKVQCLESNLKIGFVLSEGLIVDECDINSVKGRLQRIEKEPYDRVNLFKDYILGHNVVYGPGTVLVRRDALFKAIPSRSIYESKQGQNWQLMLPLSYTFDYCLINQPLFKYVVHHDSHSHKRLDYYDEIERLSGFEEIIVNTIKCIPSMPIEEIPEWIKMTNIAILQKKFQTACLFNRFIDACHYSKALGKLKRLSFEEYILGYELYRIRRKLDRLL